MMACVILKEKCYLFNNSMFWLKRIRKSDIDKLDFTEWIDGLQMSKFIAYFKTNFQQISCLIDHRLLYILTCFLVLRTLNAGWIMLFSCFVCKKLKKVQKKKIEAKFSKQNCFFQLALTCLSRVIYLLTDRH